MIELKIDNSAAVFLITERMRIELEAFKENKRLPRNVTFESMSHSQLMGFIEHAVFDLIGMLPAEILIDENNLDEIITKAIRSLAPVFHKDDLAAYSSYQAKSIFKPLEILLKRFTDKEDLYRIN